jgi:hypothetical protein
MLIIYNNVLLTNYTDSYSVLVAMYGLEMHVLAISKEINKAPYLIDKKFGPKQKMTRDTNTSISAVAILEKDNTGVMKLSVFHNSYAEIKLNPDLFRFYEVRQFTLEEKIPGEIQGWREI